MKLPALLTVSLLLAGCATTVVPNAGHVRAPTIAIPTGTAGLDHVLGANAAGLTRLFGPAAADIREGTARKLQFSNATCVLDTYLYPKGSAEPVVTYLDARQTDGSPIDRASCVGALQASRRR